MSPAQISFMTHFVRYQIDIAVKIFHKKAVPQVGKVADKFS
jgi:hypothetical protein